MRATGVGPHVSLFDQQPGWAQSGIYGLTWESDLLGCALLQEQAVLAVKEEDGECAVEQSLVDVLHQVAWRMLLGICARVPIVGVVSLRTDFLARASNWLVIFIQDDADLVHQADLLFIVAFEVVVLGSRCCCGGGQTSVYLGKQAQNVVSSDCLRLGGGGSCAHGCDCGNGANDCKQMQTIQEAAIGRVGGDWALRRPWSDCGPSDAGASFSRNQNSTLTSSGRNWLSRRAKRNAVSRWLLPNNQPLGDPRRIPFHTANTSTPPPQNIFERLRNRATLTKCRLYSTPSFNPTMPTGSLVAMPADHRGGARLALPLDRAVRLQSALPA